MSTSTIPAWLPTSITQYPKLLRGLQGLSESEQTGHLRNLARADLYFLLRYLLGRPDTEKDWYLARCREVQASPDGHLDVWAREHGKSSIITFALTIQDILVDPELTVGIFSHTRPIAKGFQRQIMREFETNEQLKRLFPDVLWANPRKDAPKWSEDEGIVVKRKGNPKEATVEAWGLVDGQPTSKHFKLRVYDDVVTRESVNTAEQIKKTTEAWELSDNLGVQTDQGGRVRFIGTRYHLYDTYAVMMERGVVKPRVYPATHNGRLDGIPVLFSQEEWERRKRTQRSQIAAQLLQNPLAAGDATFRTEWLTPYETRPRTLNVYIMGDPSKGKNKGNDSTAIAVIGVSSQGGRYLLDGYCHRMPQSRRWQCLRDLHKKWSRMPGVKHLAVGWERYGLQTDDEYFREQQQREKYFFNVDELSWTREGNESKANRVERLEPDFRNGRFYLPMAVVQDGKPMVWRVSWVCAKCAHVNLSTAKECEACKDPEASGFKVTHHKLEGFTRKQKQVIDGGSPDLVAKAIKCYDEERQVYDLTLRFIEEFESFPFGQHDDLIDAASRLYDMEPTAPMLVNAEATEPKQFFDS